jgi:hypothetical protein
VGEFQPSTQDGHRLDVLDPARPGQGDDETGRRWSERVEEHVQRAHGPAPGRLLQALAPQAEERRPVACSQGVRRRAGRRVLVRVVAQAVPVGEVDAQVLDRLPAELVQHASVDLGFERQRPVLGDVRPDQPAILPQHAHTEQVGRHAERVDRLAGMSVRQGALAQLGIDRGQRRVQLRVRRVVEHGPLLSRIEGSC